jgi:anthranilate/para-aminobenzoate synthase component II
MARLRGTENMNDRETAVLAVGAGPVGLVLAVELAHHGVRSVVVDPSQQASRHSKMDYLNARSMELLRRLDLVDEIRAQGVPDDHPFTVLWTTDFARPPVSTWTYPSVAELRKTIDDDRTRQLDGADSAVAASAGITYGEAGPRRRHCDVFFRSTDPILRTHGRFFLAIAAAGLTLVARDGTSLWTGTGAESGAYWTFLVHLGDRILLGSSPEQHVSVAASNAVMNPISGTYRYPAGGAALKGALRFLVDRTESDELYLVLDEEVKVMGRVCRDGGRVTGPHLKVMSRLAHTEYFIEGPTDLDVRDVLRATLFAPTVTASPVESACRVIARLEPTGRGYYSGVLALIDGQVLDSAIAIRTADIRAGGQIRIDVGATIVRHSDPVAEAAETRAKAAALWGALTGRPARDHAPAATGFDLVVAGPGPGDPTNLAAPKIATIRRLISGFLADGVPLLAVCLGHQILATLLGLPVRRRHAPNQGLQLAIDYFGRVERVGFYNTFAAFSPHDRAGDVYLCRDPAIGEVFAMHGPRFSAAQFHPESVLSENGSEILAGLVTRLLPASEAVAR